MKNPKNLYIFIVILGILILITTIYARVLVEKDSQDKEIISNTNISTETQNNEKTQEELKEQFMGLFTNEIHITENHHIHVKKLNQQKEIVYSAYDIQKKENNYEVDIHLPVINIQGEVPTSFNEITQTIFADKASAILKSNNTDQTIYHVNYVGYLNGNILSLAIQSTLKEGDNPQRVIIQTYNYNIETEQEVKFLDCLVEIGISTEEAKNQIQKVVKTAENEANIVTQSGYHIFTRNSNDEMYQLSNITNFLLGQNNNLYTIFAYGNKNFTSEMDIVLL